MDVVVPAASDPHARPELWLACDGEFGESDFDVFALLQALTHNQMLQCRPVHYPTSSMVRSVVHLRHDITDLFCTENGFARG